MTLQQSIHDLTGQLAQTSDTPRLDAEVLLAHLLNTTRTWVLAHSDASLSPAQTQRLNELTARLKTGEPLPYVLGTWEFFALRLRVTPDVLIPRPETELLVEQALSWLKSRPERRRAADVGTGSGCIAIALARHIPDLHITASDISAAALEIARANAEDHHLASRIQFELSDLLAYAVPAAFDLICANLPYIPTPTLIELRVYGHEPARALDGGRDGLAVIRRLARQAQPHLTSGGCLLLEIEARQSQAAMQIAQAAFPTARIDVLPDLAGLDRLLRIFT